MFDMNVLWVPVFRFKICCIELVMQRCCQGSEDIVFFRPRGLHESRRHCHCRRFRHCNHQNPPPSSAARPPSWHGKKLLAGSIDFFMIQIFFRRPVVRNKLDKMSPKSRLYSFGCSGTLSGPAMGRDIVVESSLPTLYCFQELAMTICWEWSKLSGTEKLQNSSRVRTDGSVVKDKWLLSAK